MLGIGFPYFSLPFGVTSAEVAIRSYESKLWPRPQTWHRAHHSRCSRSSGPGETEGFEGIQWGRIQGVIKFIWVFFQKYGCFPPNHPLKNRVWLALFSPSILGVKKPYFWKKNLIYPLVNDHMAAWNITIFNRVHTSTHSGVPIFQPAMLVYWRCTNLIPYSIAQLFGDDHYSCFNKTNLKERRSKHEFLQR